MVSAALFTINRFPQGSEWWSLSIDNVGPDELPPRPLRPSRHRLRSALMRVASHFAKTSPEVLATYRRLLDAARTFGPVIEEAKNTSIHLMRRTAFAGVATRRSSLILTLKSATEIKSPRIEKREQVSANRWHLEIRLNNPADVDPQITRWLKAAYELAS